MFYNIIFQHLRHMRIQPSPLTVRQTIDWDVDGLGVRQEVDGVLY